MAVIIAGMSVLFGATSVLNWSQMRQKKEDSRRRQSGLSAVRAGVTLMTVAQQHRGIAAALLNGDQRFISRLAAKQQEIGQAMVVLAHVLNEAPELAASGWRFASVQKTWRQLHTTVQTLTPEASFNEHTALIQQILYVLGDVGERAGLLENRRAGVLFPAESLLLRLPLLTECIGQARALGSGFAARGKIGAVGRIRLTFLEQRMRENLSRAVTALESLSLQAPSATCRDKVHALLNVISARIVGPEKIDITPEAYFAIATEAIDACLALWREAAQVAELTESSVAKPGFLRPLVTSLLVLSVSAGAWLAWA